MISFKPRHLRAFLAVARTGSIARAGEIVSRVPSSITHAIQEIESDLGVQLFERHVTGMHMTEFGRVLRVHTENIFVELNAARSAMQSLAGATRLNVNGPIFTLGIGRQRLLVFTELMKTRHMGAVARQFGISQPAVSLALREVEQGVGRPLMVRTSSGLVPNALGERLSLHLRRVLVEMTRAEEEMAQLQQGIVGQVSVGTLSLGRSWLLPQAIVRMGRTHPDIKVSTSEGSFEHLTTLLRAAEIDLIVGGLRSQDQLEGLVARPVVRSSIVLLGRRGHPCCDAIRKEGWPALERAHWVLPHHDTWTRSALEAALAQQGLPAPKIAVETTDVTITRALLASSDLITASSPYVFKEEIAAGDLAILPLDPGVEPRDIGVLMRSDGIPTVACRLLLAAVTATGAAHYAPPATHMQT